MDSPKKEIRTSSNIYALLIEQKEFTDSKPNELSEISRTATEPFAKSWNGSVSRTLAP